jgi:hypothetical protein
MNYKTLSTVRSALSVPRSNHFAPLYVALIALAISAVSATHTKALQLVVMATNTTAIPGAKVYTIGVNVTDSDVQLGASGVYNDDLELLGITFTGDGTNPRQASGPSNRNDLQSIQSGFIDQAALNNPVAPGFAAGPPLTLTAPGNSALYADSWWYLSGSATLQGIVDSLGDTGVVTTNAASDGSGTYTIGPTNNVGAAGYTWFDNVTPPTAGPSGTSMELPSGEYGPVFPRTDFMNANDFRGSVLSSQFQNGELTVPLLQIATSGTLSIGYDSAQGGTFLRVGSFQTNVLGGDSFIDPDPHAILDYNTNTIHGTPEPSTIVLAALGMVALLACKKWRIMQPS